MALITPTPPFLNLSSARVRVSANQFQLRLLPPPPSLISTTIRMGGGPRTFPGGVSKWQWKRMQAKKSKQLLKARLIRERQTYEMRKRAELTAAVSELERPWELVRRAAPTLFSVKADEQLKALADRFQRPGGYDLWSERDGPQLFRTPDGLPTVRFFPKGVVHSVRPYGRLDGGDEGDGGRGGRGGSSRGRRRRRSSDRRGIDDSGIWNGRDEGEVEDVGTLELEEGVREIRIEEVDVGVSNRRRVDGTMVKHERGSYDRHNRDRRDVGGRGNSEREMRFDGGRGGRMASYYYGSRSHGNRSSKHGAKDLFDELVLKRTVTVDEEEKRRRVPLNGYRGDDRRHNAGKPKSRRTEHVYGMKLKQKT